jgi:TonB family protein
MNSSGAIATEVVRALIPESLGLLPEPAGRLKPFVSSCVLNISIAALLGWLTVTQLHNDPVSARYITTPLILPSKLPPLHKMPRVKQPPPHLVVDQLRKMQLPGPEAAKPEVVHLDAPAVPTIPDPWPSIVVAPAKPAPVVKTGGFGDPMGVPANANATKPATIATAGKFANAIGAGQGAASPRTGLVTTGGFGSATGNAANGRGLGSGTVATAGFGGNAIAAAAVPKPTIQRAQFTPPEVLSEPRPQYTQEARQLRIQGEITLQVRFSVDGKVEVLRVVSGLGHGLDEQAALVAGQIRFKPAVKDGQPTDPHHLHSHSFSTRVKQRLIRQIGGMQ